MGFADRLLILLAALCGAGGVALSAAAAHAAGGANLDTAARFMLVHAAAAIAAVALCATGLVHPTIGRVAAWALLLGVALFAGDLSTASAPKRGPVPDGGACRRNCPDDRLGPSRARGSDPAPVTAQLSNGLRLR
jgi:uncharacterized membrane protein YgdD (TMEM256/DUF423 family)